MSGVLLALPKLLVLICKFLKLMAFCRTSFVTIGVLGTVLLLRRCLLSFS